MKRTMDQGAASAILFSSIFARLFWGMAVDGPIVHVTAWICPLAGLLLFLPIALIGRNSLSSDTDTPWKMLERRCPAFVLKGLALLIAFCFLLDCAAVVRMLAGTANLISMDKIPLFYLILPLGLFIAASIHLGSPAAGNCARLWNRLLPLLAAVVLAGHLRSYNPSWLVPLLGSGPESILKGGVYCASAIALLSLQWLLASPTGGKGKAFTAISVAVLASSLQLAALQMLSPALTGQVLNRSMRMQLILSNGRTATPLQILLMLLCYGGLLQLLASEATACAGFLSQILPKLPAWALPISVSASVVVLASLSYRIIEGYTHVFIRYFPAIGILVLILMISTCLSRRKTCARQS